MSYLLGGVAIKAPQSMGEANSTQQAQQRVLSGAVNRDLFGSNKRIWTLNYANIKMSDFTTINNLYQAYLTNGTAQTWQVTETNYSVAQTNVHIDLPQRAFNQQGSDYISDFTVTLTEA